MPDLGFPNNPNLNDEHTIGSKTWVWDGSSWKIKSSGFVSGGGGVTISGEATGGSALFLDGENYTYNNFLTTKSDKTPLFGKYAEKFYDHGSPTSATSFNINLENGNIHLVNFVSAATGTTKYFTFTGYVTANDVSNISLIVRGGSDLTVNWGSNVYFSEETGNPILGATGDGTSGDWVFIPFVYIPSSDTFFGGSQLTFNL